MNSLGLAWRGFKFYWKNHLGLLAGAFLASAILSGSMVVGDSVRASLRMAAEQRLGRLGFSMGGGDRWFTQTLAQTTGAAPAIVLRGAVSAGNGDKRANAVQILGVNDTFWSLSQSGNTMALASDEIGLNQALANKLGVQAGDTVIVRFEAPSAISRDAPLSGSTNEEITLRRKIAAIIEAEDFGNFNLAASQVAPDNVFVPLEELQTAVEKDGRVNALFAARSWDDAASLAAKLQENAGLDDYALQLKAAQGNQKAWEVITDRVFLDESIASKLLSQLPESHGVLTYLVNGLNSPKSENRTPYSMVTATTADEMGSLADDGAVVTQWLADDLNLTVGDEFTIRYFTVGLGRGLKEESATFKVGSVMDMTDPRVNQSWTPNFPGVSDVDNCRDWTPGIPVKLDAIRDKDETYWDEYRGTPKAFISLPVGQELWQNRFGNLTSVRFPDVGQNEDQLKTQIASHLKLTDIGLVPQDVSGAAFAAAKGSVDFGGLFIGLSLFLIAAALVFSSLLFLFTLERRVSQMGVLLAVGWTQKMVRRAVLGEAALVALMGSILGIFGGILYTKLALAGLNGIWADATVGLKLIYATTPTTLTVAFMASLIASAGTMWWSSRRMFKASARGLLTDTWRSEASAQNLDAKSRGQTWFVWIPWLLIIAAVALGFAGSQSTNPQAMAGMFFGAGFSLLAAGLMIIRSRFTTGKNHLATDMRQIALRNVNRRPGRSLSVIGMMAGGIFLVIAVNAFRLGTDSDVTKRTSGTGGFALMGESSLPVYEDLNGETAWDEFALDEKVMQLAQVVPFRVRQGDDASCLNLNRAQTPMLTAVDPAPLVERGAFSFAKGSWQDIASQSPENCLGHSRTAAMVEKPIPAIADQATALWGLGKGVGDTLDYTDSNGQIFQVQLVALLSGSVLQGKIIINEADYLKKYPDAAGYQFFLLDVKGDTATFNDNMDKVRSQLTRQLEQRGLALEKTSDRLAAFNAVQNTYIGIFTVLGGLGVVLGTAGLGVLAMRNVLERRSEFGLMQALGFRSGALHSMVFTEHAALMVAGLLLGLLSAGLAVWPNLSQASSDIALPLVFIAVISLAILAVGLFSCWLASRLALRGKLLDSLRRE